MMYAILCYHDEDMNSAWTAEREAEVMGKLGVVC